MPHKQRLCIYAPSYDDGGVGRMLANLARGIVARGYPVDFLAQPRWGPFKDSLPAQVNIIDAVREFSSAAVPDLTAYLRAHEPAIVISAKERADSVVVAAARAAAGETRVATIIGTDHVQRFRGANVLRRWRAYRRLRRLYRQVDILIAVSQGVADALAHITGVAREQIFVAPNPTVGAEFFALAKQPPQHPWLNDNKTCPVVLGVGRLGTVKDFATLIRAFARVRKEMAVRLLIIGEGRRRRRLEKLARRLDVQDDVSLPGFADNAYSCMAHADLFVLSSHREGSPNTLIEALAAGTPVVSTDCPSGPREILADGRYGRLVPVGDVRAMATAMREALAEPRGARDSRAAVRQFEIDASTQRYLEIFGWEEE